MKDHGVLISCCVHDHVHAVNVLHETLVDRFGASRVLRDTGQWPAADFAIEKHLDRCAVLLAVIGPRWRDMIGQPDSAVHLSVASALRRGVRVVPVLLDSTPLPEPARLPRDLAGFDQQPAWRLRRGHVDSDVRRLVEALEVDSTPGSPPRNDLPRDVPDFIGRADELQRLFPRLRGGATAPSTTIKVVDGMPGVGKSALVIHAAHALGADYPDGQLFVDLHGHTPGQPPVDAKQALGALLSALGVPDEKHPRSMEERAALWRAQVAGRRLLIVLDDALSERQVRPLLPGASGCLVLVTSRRRLTGLEGAEPVSLCVLPPEDAATLFLRVAEAKCGGGKAMAEAVDEVVDLCGHLPLAIRLAAARLRHHPAWAIADLAERLRDCRQRLAELRTGDLEMASAFQLSYRNLTEEQQRALRLLGLHPGPTFTTLAAATLFGRTPAQTERLLEELFTAHLLDHHSAGRYCLHSLVHSYAMALEEADDPVDRAEAVTRVLDFYLCATHRAASLVSPGRLLPDTDVETPPELPTIPDERAGWEWLDAECPNLMAAIQYASDHEMYSHTWRIPVLLWHFFHVRSHLDDWLYSHLKALTAARNAKDRFGEGEVLNYLACVYSELGQYKWSQNAFEHALEVRREVGDLPRELTTLTNLVQSSYLLGDYVESVDYYEQAKALPDYQKHNAVALLHRNIGMTFMRLGEYEWAVRHIRDAIRLSKGDGRRQWEVKALSALGQAHLEQDEYRQALNVLHGAVALAKELGDRKWEANAVIQLGVTYDRLTNYGQALRYLHHALTITRQINVPPNEGEALNRLGAVYRELGRIDLALDCQQRAAGIARMTKAKYQEALALQELGHLALATNGRQAAQEHWRQALLLYHEMEVPEVDEIRKLLGHDGTELS